MTKYLSKQMIFDIVAEHLLTQNQRATAIDEDGEHVCMYRGEKDTKCAVGVLILDEEYDPGMEGANVFALFNSPRWRPALNRCGLHTHRHFALLDGLQSIHDTHPPDISWVIQLKVLARKHRLSDAVVVRMDTAIEKVGAKNA